MNLSCCPWGILRKTSIESYSVATGENKSLALTLELLNRQFLLDFLGYTSWSLCEVELSYSLAKCMAEEEMC